MPVAPQVSAPAPAAPISAAPIAPAPAAPAPPVVTTTSTIGDPPDFLTVQWIETTIGGTYSTWVPRTWTFHYNAQSPAPRPGRGEIGMGTLTGETGKTKTIMMAAAAPTHGPDWMRGVAVVAGAGLAAVLV